MGRHRAGDEGRRSREVFARFLASESRRVDAALDRALSGSGGRPAAIGKAMRYSALGGGKRLRPAMAVLGYRTAGGRGAAVYPLAAAIEMIHAFSLIHDDLPAMDDDDFRRGRPSNHKVFGEAVAILAGDALLAEAFGVLLRARRGATPERILASAREVAEAIGTSGIIGGQVVDVQCAGRRVKPPVVEYIHRHKTGSFMRASLTAGSVLGGAGTPLIAKLGEYGENVGLAFQIADDLLDLEGDFGRLGRAPGGDARNKKVTYPGVVGVDRSRERVRGLIREALRVTPAFGGYRLHYVGLALFIAERAGLRSV
jgi:geranylgeranyl diphosphate synthase type II